MRRGETNGHPPRRELGDALALVLREQAGTERYRRRQAQVRRRRTETVDRARPPEFDESGFPIAQRTPGFVIRVARLLGPT
jgi:hypothetical protein